MAETHFTTRRLTIDDYDALIRVWADSGLPYKPRGRDSRDKIEKQMSLYHCGFFGVFDGGKLVGAVVATYDGRKGWINRIGAHPDYRRQGIAGMLIKECETFLHGLGAEVIGALIEQYNFPSMELFQKNEYLFHEGLYHFSKRRSKEV